MKAEDRIGAALPIGCQQPGDHKGPVGIVDVEELPDAATSPPGAGVGNGNMALARRKRTGHLSTIFHPLVVTRTACHPSLAKSR